MRKRTSGGSELTTLPGLKPPAALTTRRARIVSRSVRSTAPEIHPFYSVEGEPAHRSDVLEHLEGYRGSGPVQHGNAGKAAWVDYAVARRDEGVSEEDARAVAEQMTKEDLVAELGQK